MTYDEVISCVSRLRSKLANGGDDSVFTAEEKTMVARFYFEEFGEHLRDCGCHHRYSDAVMDIYHTLKSKGKMAKEQKYMLKAGVIVWIGNDCYNRHSLTDELAEKYLNLHPDARSKFDKVPAIDTPAPEAEDTPGEEVTDTPAPEEKKQSRTKTTTVKE